MSANAAGLQDVIEDRWKRLDLSGEDSRLKYKKITHPTLNMERTFCVMCSKPKGWVTTDSFEFIKANNIIVVCDECAAAFGPMGLQEAPVQEVKR